ncbi:MAG TPA: hypothetical protein VMT20_21910 [Terriglobia bacterium]|nr:hypothetical protein [Terriglobia bacterium]
MKLQHYLLTGCLILAASSCLNLRAQEAQFGVSVPLEITGGMLDTDRAQSDDPAAPPVTAGFKMLATPLVKLGSHWYIYSAVQVRSLPFFYQDAYSADRGIDTDVLQGFVGYARTWGKATVGFRAGKLSSAFGSFPPRYNDTENALIDQPLPYTYLALKPRPGSDPYGLTPVTLYGLPGAEVDLSWRRVDARFQLTNSNPYNPLSLTADNQHPQWTVGGGYTIRQGLRFGVSAYRGPWLDESLVSSYPAGMNFRDFPASGIGVDGQWARGHWNVSGEWQRFVFNFPKATQPTAMNFAYLEVKRNISPRWYAAVRANDQANNTAASRFLLSRQVYEAAVGFRPDRLQLIKVGYEWVRTPNDPWTHDNVFGIQFVTTINRLAKAL